MNSNILLQHVMDYIDLEENEKAILTSKLKYKKYSKGQYLVQQGDVCNYSGFMISGCSKMFYLDADGNEHIINFAIKNWWTGELGSYISREPSDYNIQFVEDSELFLISIEDREELFKQLPKIERFFRILVENALVSAQRRIVQNFSLTAKERYIKFKHLYPTIEQQVPQYMIASYLGITKEFLSKIKGQIAHEK